MMSRSSATANRLGQERAGVYTVRAWFRKGGEPRQYSFWAADSMEARSLVLGGDRLPRELLPDLIANYEAWEEDHLDANGLFWQNTTRVRHRLVRLSCSACSQFSEPGAGPA